MSVNGLGAGAQFPAMKGLDKLSMRPIEKHVADMVSATVTAVVGHALLSGFEKAFGELGGKLGSALGSQAPVCEFPTPNDSAHPAGSLKVGQDGVITTPGGYKVEATKQFEWKITSPEGKSTRIWGDPHVDEGDGGKWDFKRNSTFMLPDGTRINCSTTPWAKNPNMTVSKGLEVIAGNERVLVSDIDKGKGKVGGVTQDGFAHANSFGKNDVFVMGGDGDDWSFQGKEITGSHNGGESFKLGKELKPLVDLPNKFGGAEEWVKQIVDDLFKHLDQMFQQPPQQPPPFVPPFMGGGRPPHGGCWGKPQYGQGLGDAFKDLGRMFNTLGDLFKLTEALNRRMMPVAV